MPRITDQITAGSLTGAEVLLVSELSTTVTITASTISAVASDNSFNDSADGFVAAGFVVGDRVNVTGFTGDTANNIYAATITALTVGKMTIGGTDGDVIVDDAAGESVTISKWISRRTTAQTVGNLGGGGGGGITRIGTWNLATKTLATADELDVDVSAYTEITICVTGGTITTGGNIFVTTSADGGTSFRTTSGDYKWSYVSTTITQTPADRSAVFVAGGAAATTLIHGTTKMIGLNDANSPVTSVGVVGSSADTYSMHQYTTNLEAVDTIRLATSNGSAMTAGTLTIWGQ